MTAQYPEWYLPAGPQPREYQKEIVAQSLAHLEAHGSAVVFIGSGLGYAMEMGTGKTKTAIDLFSILRLQKKIDAVVITAPNGVHRQWVEEQIPEHCPIDDVATYIWRSNDRSKRAQEDFKTLLAADFPVLAMNIEALSHKRPAQILEYFLNHRKNVLWVMDESISIKSFRAARTKTALRLSGLARYRIFLSGAPVTRGVEDMWSQLRWIDPSLVPKSYYAFRNRYCVTTPIPGAPAGAVKIVGYQRMDEFQRIIAPCVFRVLKKDCLDLPDKVYMDRYVELTPQQQRMYTEMRKTFQTQLEDGTIVDVPSAIAALTKLQTILCGHLNEIPVPSNRAKVAADIVEETQGKTIVFTRFQIDTGLVHSELKSRGIPSVRHHGGMSTTDRDAALEWFKKAPEPCVLIATTGSAGIGLNLTHASTVVYYSNTFNAGERWQSEDRIHRLGQTNKCVYVDLIAPKTMDSKILANLRAKKTMAASLLDVKELIHGG